MRERCCASQQWHPARYLRGWAGYFALAAQLKLADVLLETVAARPHANPESAGPRRSTPASHPPRQESRASPTNVPWHMAKTIASGVGMTNAWLQEQGLLSLKSLWAQLAPLRRTA
jgi:RNA-directed DNA polymerase